jgi:aspartate aminotransferase-like enzyme
MERQQLLMLPGPTNVPPRVMRAMMRPTINHRGPEFEKVYEDVLENLGYAFQTHGDVFPISASGTGGVECAVANLVCPGDKILVPVHGVFSQRVKETVEAFGGIVVQVPVDWTRAPSVEQIDEVLGKEKDIKASIFVYNETSTGVTIRDLRRIGEVVKRHGSLFMVDAISILGGDDLPVDAWHVDVCVTGSQKCLACPPGLALISVSEDGWRTITRDKARRHVYYFDLLKMKDSASKKETPFTPSLPLYFALDEALKILREEGLENRIARHRKCAKAFYDAIHALGLSTYPEEANRSNTVIAVNNPKGIEDKAIRDSMRQKHNIVVGGGMGRLRGAMFRIGCMGMISEAEVTATVAALESTLCYLGYQITLGTGLEKVEKVFHA